MCKPWKVNGTGRKTLDGFKRPISEERKLQDDPWDEVDAENERVDPPKRGRYYGEQANG